MQPKWFEKKFIDPKNLKEKIAKLREEKKSIATLNGSFDLLHAGHLFIIHEAKKQADCLIVALNSDASIQTYKGKDRPIIPLIFRLQMMAALEWVDFVTFFEETTPNEILKVIRPDVHVNGEEYKDSCIEKEVVESFKGRLHFVKRIEGLATSSILKKVKECAK